MRSSDQPTSPTSPESVKRPAEFGKIVGFCTLASVCYGLVHDTFTMLVCKPYFTEHHPDVFHTDNTLVLILGWGIYATWWMGAILGVIVGMAATIGRSPVLGARRLIGPLVKTLGVVLVLAFCSWLFVMVAGPRVARPQGAPNPDAQKLMASATMHNTSYMLSTVCGFGMAGYAVALRRKAR